MLAATRQLTNLTVPRRRSPRSPVASVKSPPTSLKAWPTSTLRAARGVRVHTVENHLRSILRKTGVESRAKLALATGIDGGAHAILA